jgi:hypothetical protein
MLSQQKAPTVGVGADVAGWGPAGRELSGGKPTFPFNVFDAFNAK